MWRKGGNFGLLLAEVAVREDYSPGPIKLATTFHIFFQIIGALGHNEVSVVRDFTMLGIGTWGRHPESHVTKNGPTYMLRVSSPSCE